MKQTRVARPASSRPRLSAPRESFSQYLEEIGAHPLLDAEDEARLARRIRAGDRDALEQLVSSNLRFVVSVARRYQRFDTSLPDLVHEGNVGLIRAAERFDERRQVRFTSYAVWWIRQAIIESISTRWTPIPVPRERMPAARRPPARASGSFFSLDEPAGVDRANRLHEVLAVGEDHDPLAGLDRHGLRHVLDASLTLLDEREQLVLRLYYGLDDEPAVGLKEIGARLGVSRERVGRIRERALSRLRCGASKEKLARYLG